MINGMTLATAKQISDFIHYWATCLTTGDPVDGADLVQELTTLYIMAEEVIAESEGRIFKYPERGESEQSN